MKSIVSIRAVGSRSATAALVALLLLGTACSDSGDPTVGDEPKPVPEDSRGATTTSPPAAVDVSTIPDRIDEPYVNAVLAGLRTAEAEGIRVILRTKRFGPEAAKYLAAVYDDDELQDQAAVWLREIGEGLEGFKQDPAPARSIVVRTMSASQECISLEVEDDVSGYVASPGPYTRQFLQLVPLDRSRDRAGYNPTAWMIHQAGLRSDGSDPGDLCAE